MQRRSLAALIVGMVLLFAGVVLMSSATYVVEPGTRGIKVTLGKVTDQFLAEGFGWKTPFVTTIVPVNIRQQTQAMKADCFSSDLQQVVADLRVLYRVPEQSVVQIYKEYSGDPFDSLIAPRVQEAIKETTALQTAEEIVKNREKIKQKTLESARLKIGNILTVEDVVIRNIDLSDDLEKAIEAKMVAEQQAAQARFSQMQAHVEAETAIIKAKGEAEAIRVRGEALKLNPAFIRWQIVDRWNGKSPLVVPSDASNPVAGFAAANWQSRAGGNDAMNPRLRATLQIMVLLLAVGFLVYLFPRASEFVEMAGRELRYFWWLVLILALALWLIFGLGRKRP